MAINVPNPGNPAQAQINAPRPVAPATAAPVRPAGAVPNPSNPAQQQINQTVPQQQQSATQGAGARAGAVGTTVTPVSVTVPPEDASYYDQIARLNAAWQGSLANYNRANSDAAATDTLANQQLQQQWGQTLQTTRDTANRQGLLESGILAQRAGLVGETYTNRIGTANNRQAAAEQAAANSLATAQNTLSVGSKTAYDATVARALKADVALGPTTPTVPTPKGSKVVGRAAPVIGSVGNNLRRAAANRANGNTRTTAGNRARNLARQVGGVVAG